MPGDQEGLGVIALLGSSAEGKGRVSIFLPENGRFLSEYEKKLNLLIHMGQKMKNNFKLDCVC